MELLDSTADRLIAKVVRTVDAETEPVARASAAIAAVLSIFAGHRSMARLLLIDGLGSGAMFRVETLRLHDRFTSLIASYLDGAVADRAIPPLDTRVAGAAWFGAIHELVVRWLVTDRAAPLEDAFPTVRDLLLRSVGVPDSRIAALAAGDVPR